MWYIATSDVILVNLLLSYHVTSDVAPCHLATVELYYVRRNLCQLATVV